MKKGRLECTPQTGNQTSSTKWIVKQTIAQTVGRLNQNKKVNNQHKIVPGSKLTLATAIPVLISFFFASLNKSRNTIYIIKNFLTFLLILIIFNFQLKNSN